MNTFIINELDYTSIPTCAGVYLFKDARDRIIYVGKAHSLKKRLLSYFQRTEQLPIKTQKMLSHATTFNIICTKTEKEALLLEATLIKKHKPRYNIILKDDKKYLMFALVKDTPYPRLLITRKTIGKNTMYFGPYTCAQAARATWRYIHTIFPLRRCSDAALKNRTKPCLYYHMKQCLAPCIDDVPQEEYQEHVQNLELFLRGKTEKLLSNLTKEMEHFAETLAFEKATIVREQIFAIQKTLERQSVVLQEKTCIDVFGVAEIAGGLSLAILFIKEGRLHETLHYFFPNLTFEDSSYLLYTFLSQHYNDTTVLPDKILLPFITEEYKNDYALLEDIFAQFTTHPVHICAPTKPEYKQLTEIATNNAKQQKPSEEFSPAKLLATMLHTSKPIYRIEAVDVSHLAGEHTKVGLVVWEEGCTAPVEYRVFNIEDACGDDYKALSLWIQRRIEDTSLPLPDLLLIDGGKGQLSAIYSILTAHYKEVPFALLAITKARTEDGRPDRRAGNTADRLFVPNRSNPLPVKSGSPLLLYLQQIRDSVHSFSIQKQRYAKRKHALESELLRIKGVGEKTANLLLQHFGSVRHITKASISELTAVRGISEQKAQLIKQHLASILQ